MTRPDRGWFWFIPISDTVISVGAVVPQVVYNANAKADTGGNPRPLSGRDSRGRAAGRGRDAGHAPPASMPTIRISTVSTPVIGRRHRGRGRVSGPHFLDRRVLAMQSGIEAAEADQRGLRDGDLRAASLRRVRATMVRRYRHFRRFATGFYDPAFRDLFFNRSSRFGIYEAVLSVSGGNWRPSMTTRIRLEAFFALVAVQRLKRQISGGGGFARQCRTRERT